MPGAVPRTSTIALTNNTVPYALQIANKGFLRACLDNLALKRGVNTLDGKVVYRAVADAQGLSYAEVEDVLGALTGLN